MVTLTQEELTDIIKLVLRTAYEHGRYSSGVLKNFNIDKIAAALRTNSLINTPRLSKGDFVMWCPHKSHNNPTNYHIVGTIDDVWWYEERLRWEYRLEGHGISAPEEEFRKIHDEEVIKYFNSL